jgi:hypothetical protein
MRTGAALAAGLVAIAVAVALVLADSKPRQAGSNYVHEAGPVVELKGSGSRCEEHQVIPADTGALRLLVGTYHRPMPEVRVSVRSGGGAIASGTLPAGGREGHVRIPVDRVGRLVDDAEVCVAIRAADRRRQTVLYGSGDQLRFEWLRPESESWFELVPTLAHRFGLAKPFLSGAWVLALAGLLLAAAWALALRLVVRELGR